MERRRRSREHVCKYSDSPRKPENNKSENEFRLSSREMKKSDSFDCFEGSDCGITCKVDRNKTERSRFDVGFSSSFSFS